MSENEPWVSTEAVAQHLGKPVSWIHQAGERLNIPRRRLGNHYRYKLSEIDSWVSGLE